MNHHYVLLVKQDLQIVNGLIQQANGASHLVIAPYGRSQEKWQVVNFLRS
jgi:hypothetical protein